MREWVVNLVQFLLSFTEKMRGADLLIFDWNKIIGIVASCFLVV